MHKTSPLLPAAATCPGDSGDPIPVSPRGCCKMGIAACAQHPLGPGPQHPAGTRTCKHPPMARGAGGTRCDQGPGTQGRILHPPAVHGAACPLVSPVPALNVVEIVGGTHTEGTLPKATHSFPTAVLAGWDGQLSRAPLGAGSGPAGAPAKRTEWGIGEGQWSQCDTIIPTSARHG